MKKLTRKAQEKARDFIYEQARLLEQARYAYHFEAGTAENVFTQLATFQNPDGGFGHGLEPDVRLPDSSVIATTVALQILRTLQAPATHPLVEGAIRYLLQTYDAGQKAWPIVPENIDEAPHAPWWRYDADLSNFLINPRAEIVGYFLDYGRLVPQELRDTLLEAVVAHLMVHPDEMEMHDLLCYVRLAETAALPPQTRAAILPKLERVVVAAVATERSAWEAYGLKPVTVADTPHSPFVPVLAEAVARNLDYEIDEQQEDGSWKPPWSWGDAFPQAWQKAQREWQGVLTLKGLRVLQAFGRFE